MQTINGGCGANAYCLPAGPAQKKCFCNKNFVGDGYTCSGTLRQVITSHPSLTTLNSYLNVCRLGMILGHLILLIIIEKLAKIKPQHFTISLYPRLIIMEIIFQ